LDLLLEERPILLGRVETEPVSFRVGCKGWSWLSQALVVRHISDFALNELLSVYPFFRSRNILFLSSSPGGEDNE